MYRPNQPYTTPPRHPANNADDRMMGRSPGNPPPSGLDSFPAELREQLLELDRELQEGDITQKGYEKRRQALLSAYQYPAEDTLKPTMQMNAGGSPWRQTPPSSQYPPPPPPQHPPPPPQHPSSMGRGYAPGAAERPPQMRVDMAPLARPGSGDMDHPVIQTIPPSPGVPPTYPTRQGGPAGPRPNPALRDSVSSLPPTGIGNFGPPAHTLSAHRSTESLHNISPSNMGPPGGPGLPMTTGHPIPPARDMRSPPRQYHEGAYPPLSTSPHPHHPPAGPPPVHGYPGPYGAQHQRNFSNGSLSSLSSARAPPSNYNRSSLDYTQPVPYGPGGRSPLMRPIDEHGMPPPPGHRPMSYSHSLQHQRMSSTGSMSTLVSSHAHNYAPNPSRMSTGESSIHDR
jgi:hypothetical protein